jgi:cold shock CspA family protein
MAYKLRKFNGSVVRFWPERAYGYVRTDVTRREAHFHFRDFEHRVGGDEIKIGTRLEFYLADDPRGLSAIRVSICEDKPCSGSTSMRSRVATRQ